MGVGRVELARGAFSLHGNVKDAKLAGFLGDSPPWLIILSVQFKLELSGALLQ